MCLEPSDNFDKCMRGGKDYWGESWMFEMEIGGSFLTLMIVHIQNPVMIIIGVWEAARFVVIPVRFSFGKVIEGSVWRLWWLQSKVLKVFEHVSKI